MTEKEYTKDYAITHSDRELFHQMKYGILTVNHHDDVIKWNVFRVTGPSWGESTGHQ